MKEIKKYTSVIRYGKKGTENVLNVGDYITITEKVDGANGSFCYDEESSNKISCYSRNQPLTEENTLRGFYSWVNENISPISEKLNKNYRYIGEWLIPHTVAYKEECYKNFYLFSIWDDEEQKYLSDEIVKSEAKRLNLKTVKYLYEGEFISYEHLEGFVGKSEMSLETDKGEGIVIKNVGYFDHNNKQVFVKMVRAEFAECMGQKQNKDSKVIDTRIGKISTLLTKARIEKLIHKGIDEGTLSETLTLSDMGVVIKAIGNSIFTDIIKEESDMLEGIEESAIRKTIGKNIPPVIREIISNR